MVTFEQLTEFFDRYGWRYERRTTDLVRTGFAGDTGHYEIWIRTADPWLYFTINPYVPRREEQPHGDAVLEVMLRANHEMNMAKFGLDKDGDVALSVEVPAEGLVYPQFADALTALSHYADAFRPRFDEALEDDGGEVV